jgi:hypothetical protein
MHARQSGTGKKCCGRLAGVSFPHGETFTLLLALIWAAVVPLLSGFAAMYRSKAEADA